MDGESCKTGQKASSSSSSKLLSPDDARNLLDSVDLFLIDCDGVIYKGYTFIDGVKPTLEMLRSKGKKLVFVTNNSRRSRKNHVQKFHSLGIAVSEDEIFCASFAAAMYLKVNDFPQDKKVYLIGAEGLREELELAGFTVINGLEDGKMTVPLTPNCPIEHDRSVGAVVVELDRTITHSKLLYGTLCIRKNPGCLFIATNREAVGYMTDLPEWPGAGCMVAAISESTQKKPIVVGKPSTLMMDLILQKYPITTSKMCMVGDRLESDILFGQNAGCKTLLVFSGVETQSTLEDPSNHVQPDYYTGKVSDILSLL